jgi:putative component of toxin-antitoxin plasmid stabilization module
MITIRETETFSEWFKVLAGRPRESSDCRLGAAIELWQSRRCEASWPGVSELRIDYGPGYCVYYT